MRVFLGGTCNESTWREKLIPDLQKYGIEYFNPVVENWTTTAQVNEIRERETCDFCLYVITPRILGYYAIAEAVEDSIKHPYKTIFAILYQDNCVCFTEAKWHSLQAVARLIKRNGGATFTDLKDVAPWLNDYLIRGGIEPLEFGLT